MIFYMPGAVADSAASIGLAARLRKVVGSTAALPYIALVLGAVAASSAGALIKMSYAPTSLYMGLVR